MRTSFSTNQIILLGNITKDPEAKMTANDTFILHFNIATNRSVKVGEEYEDRATFHRIVCIGKGAEWLENKLKKGQKVLVVGRQENRSYETENGEKRYISEVIANEVTPFLSSSSGSKQVEQNKAEEEYAHDPVADEVSDDVPF